MMHSFRHLFAQRASAVVLATSALSFVVGCSSTPLPTLTVNTVSGETSVGGEAAPSGQYLAEVNVTLENPSDSASYPMWFDNFQLATTPSDLGLSPPYGPNGAVDDACSLYVTLGPAIQGPSHFTCNLVFAIPCTETGYELIYTPADVGATVPSLPPPSDCGNSSASSSGSSSSGSSSSGSSSSGGSGGGTAG